MKKTDPSVVRFIKNAHNEYKAGPDTLPEDNPLRTQNSEKSFDYFKLHCISNHGYTSFEDWFHTSHIRIDGYYPYNLSVGLTITFFYDSDTDVVRKSILGTRSDFAEIPLGIRASYGGVEEFFTGHYYKISDPDHCEGGIYALFESDGEWSLVLTFHSTTTVEQTFPDLDAALAYCSDKFANSPYGKKK